MLICTDFKVGDLLQLPRRFRFKEPAFVIVVALNESNSVGGCEDHAKYNLCYIQQEMLFKRFTDRELRERNKKTND